MKVSKWEYMRVQLNEIEDRAVEERLNGWGEDGWQLVSVSSISGYRTQFAYFKRQVS